MLKKLLMPSLVLFSLLSIILFFWLSKTETLSTDYKQNVITHTPWKKGAVYSHVNYRIFSCDKEIVADLSAVRNGLYQKSSPSEIIIDGQPQYVEEILLPEFFTEIGGILNHQDGSEHQLIMSIPIRDGLHEFWSDNTCDEKPAQLFVLHHRLDHQTKPPTEYPRILWKYSDFLFQNLSPHKPADCLIFISGTADILKKPWPDCDR